MSKLLSVALAAFLAGGAIAQTYGPAPAPAAGKKSEPAATTATVTGDQHQHGHRHGNWNHRAHFGTGHGHRRQHVRIHARFGRRQRTGPHLPAWAGEARQRLPASGTGEEGHGRHHPDALIRAAGAEGTAARSLFLAGSMLPRIAIAHGGLQRVDRRRGLTFWKVSTTRRTICFCSSVHFAGAPIPARFPAR
jgi:hypothetical protein